MSMDQETVKKVARLARIRLTEEELSRMGPQLNGILSWIDQLNEVDTDNVQPLRAVHDLQQDLRKDEITDGGVPEKVLANAPEETQKYFVVPKIVE